MTKKKKKKKKKKERERERERSREREREREWRSTQASGRVDVQLLHTPGSVAAGALYASALRKHCANMMPGNLTRSLPAPTTQIQTSS